MESPSSTPSSCASSVKSLRQSVRSRMLEGLPLPISSSERQTAWLLALKISYIDPTFYVSALESTHNKYSSNIQGDVNRCQTLKCSNDLSASSTELSDRVKRILIAFSCQFPSGYIQGMHQVAVPFVCVLPESAAYCALHTLLTKYLPTYFAPGLRGVYNAVSLVESVLQAVDPILSRRLQESNCQASVWSFPLLLSLLVELTPFSEIIRIWDFLLAFRPCGPAIIVLVVVSLLVGKRDQIFRCQNPNLLLKGSFFNPVVADHVLKCTKELIPKLPEDLRISIINHGVES
ncbi:hypothetical protein GEMRC1_010763 [Eukaryota sp. GEM-RC1]